VKQETGKPLQKATRAIRAAETLPNDGDVAFAAGRAYYAMFYAASALWLIAAFGKRVQGDYGIDAVLTPEEVGRMIERAREFLQEARRLVGATSTGPGPATL
jgi:uncharacterized protein (UPF0332 family)